MADECPDCEIKLEKGTCPQCGWRKALLGGMQSSAPAAKVPAHCPADGGRLQADGWCETGQGYFEHMSCPFPCPICRQPLSWNGGCDTCKGCTSGNREDWTFPGERYEFEGAHWRRVAGLEAGRRACTVEENMAGARAVRDILARAAVTLAKQ